MGYDNKSMQELKELKELYKKRYDIFKIATIVSLIVVALSLFLIWFGFIDLHIDKMWKAVFVDVFPIAVVFVCAFLRERYKKKLSAVDKAIIKIEEAELEAMKNKANDTNGDK